MSINAHEGMPSEHSGPPASDEVLRELERVNSGPSFRKSDILRHLLTFLVEGFVDSPDTSFKEHEIATRVLGRSGDFDPRLDSAVRVHTARLRTKLAEYYAGEGRSDPILFEIPKGAYQLTVRYNVVAEPSPAPAERGGLARVRKALPVVWACLATALAIILVVRGPEGRPKAPESLRTFWADLARPGEQTTLVFSHTRFLLEPGGLRYVTDVQAPPELLNESYTGTGEVYGASALSSLFAHYWLPIRVKCGRFLTWDDARQQNLVFVGGPNVNLQLGELPELQRFRFSRSALEDAHSDPAAPLRYGNSGRPYSFDHAVIAFIRLGTGRNMLVLAGTMTLGTQAAVDFVTREETTQKLLAALKCPRAGPVPSFEALLRVQVTGSVPVESQILAVHLRK